MLMLGRETSDGSILAHITPVYTSQAPISGVVESGYRMSITSISVEVGLRLRTTGSLELKRTVVANKALIGMSAPSGTSQSLLPYVMGSLRLPHHQESP